MFLGQSVSFNKHKMKIGYVKPWYVSYWGSSVFSSGFFFKNHGLEAYTGWIKRVNKAHVQILMIIISNKGNNFLDVI